MDAMWFICGPYRINRVYLVVAYAYYIWSAVHE